MTHHKDCKGIIHCTSYDQLNFIMSNISKENKKRLLKTDPDIERDLVIENHSRTNCTNFTLTSFGIRSQRRLEPISHNSENSLCKLG